MNKFTWKIKSTHFFLGMIIAFCDKCYLDLTRFMINAKVKSGFSHYDDTSASVGVSQCTRDLPHRDGIVLWFVVVIPTTGWLIAAIVNRSHGREIKKKTNSIFRIRMNFYQLRSHDWTSDSCLLHTILYQIPAKNC
jgi:hypothetical protein